MAISFQFTPTGADYGKCLQSYYLRSMGSGWLLVSLLILQFVLGLVSLNAPALETRSDWYGALILPLVPLFLLLVLFVAPSRVAALVKANKQMTSQVFWVVDSDKIVIRDAVSETKSDWSLFGQVVELKEYYLFLNSANKAFFHFVPKRAFASPDEESAFRELFVEKLGEPKKLVTEVGKSIVRNVVVFGFLGIGTVIWLILLIWRIMGC